MFIGAIKYQDLDIACAYKNGVIVWRPTQYKLVSFDNTLITSIPVFSLSTNEVEVLPKITYRLNLPNTSIINNTKAQLLYFEEKQNIIRNLILSNQDSWVRKFYWQISTNQKFPLNISPLLLTRLTWIHQLFTQNILTAAPSEKIYSTFEMSVFEEAALFQIPVRALYLNQKVNTLLLGLLNAQKSINTLNISPIKINSAFGLVRRKSKIGEARQKIFSDSKQSLFAAETSCTETKKDIVFGGENSIRVGQGVTFDFDKNIGVISIADLNTKVSKVSQIMKNIDFISNANALVGFIKAGESLQLLLLNYEISLNIRKEKIGNINKKLYFNNANLLTNSVTNNTIIVKLTDFINKNILRCSIAINHNIEKIINLNNDFVLSISRAIKNKIRFDANLINFSFLKNGIYLSSSISHWINIFVKEDLRLLKSNIFFVGKDLLLNNGVLLQQISPTLCEPKYNISFLVKPFLQFNVGLYYFADNKNIINSIFRVHEKVSLDFLRLFMSARHLTVWDSSLNGRVSKTVDTNFLISQYLLHDFQLEVAKSAKLEFFKLIINKSSADFKLGKKRFVTDFLSNTILENFASIGLSNLFYITTNNTCFSSNVIMRSFSTLDMDSWIYPIQQGTNLFIQQVNSYFPTTGEIA